MVVVTEMPVQISAYQAIFIESNELFRTLVSV